MEINGVDLKELNYRNADDIANGSKGIYRLYVYNHTKREYRYEYYLCRVVQNKYLGYHQFSLKVEKVLNGTKKVVGNIINTNGRQLYRNYYEMEKAKEYCRYCKHIEKMKMLELGVI